MRVQARIPFLYAKHLIDEAIKFPLALSENSKLAFVQEDHMKINNNAWCSYFHVICAMQIMSAKQPDTFTNVLLNIKTRQLENTFWKPTGTKSPERKPVSNSPKLPREI